MTSLTFQGSRRSGVAVTIYPNLGDGSYGDAIHLTGTRADSPVPAIVSVHVQNALAQGASFSVSFKRAGFVDPFEAFPTDSWCDIELSQQGLSWHVMRGLIDEVRLNSGVGGGGTTTHTYTITGRSFQRIYEDTPAMFNPLLGDKEVSVELQEALRDFVGSPDTIVKTLLVTTLRNIGRRGRGYWAMPTHMPGAKALFVDTVLFDSSRFDLYDISRSLFSPSLYEGGPLWGLAQQYSDPTLCELYTELMPRGSGLSALGGIDTDGTVGLPVGSSTMVTYLRDRPYMAVDPLIGRGPLGADSPYFQLPRFTLPKQLVTGIDVGLSTYERLNAFVLGPPPDGGGADYFPTYKQPLWDTAEQRAHGLRQMNIAMTYQFFGNANQSDLRTVDEATRATKRLVRDFYCLNHTLFSGTVSFGQGCPWLKVGCRLQISDLRGLDRPLHAYIEAVSHTYTVQGGTKTQVSFTRGFYGSEAQHLAELNLASSRYVEPYINLGLGATR